MLLSRPPKDNRLKPFVEALWTCETSDLSGYERVLPNGRAQLFINLHENSLSHFNVCGSQRQRASGMVVQPATDEAVVINRADQRKLCGVLFSVSGAFAFFGGAVSETSAELIDLDRLSWGEHWSLHDRLRKTCDPALRLDVLEAALIQHAPERQTWDMIVHKACILLQKGLEVRTVANHCDVSQQTLITRFRERTGLTPKTYSRIERFQHLIQYQQIEASWAHAALEAGYSDQAHMVREFRRFSGITPTKYQPNNNQRNHVALAN